MKRIKSLIKYIVIIAVVILFSRFVLFRNSIKTAQVKKIEITDRVVKRTVSASGEIKSEKEASLSFKAAGKIQSVGVSKGDEVKKDDLLAQQDNYDAFQDVQYYKDARDVTLRDIDLFIENYETNLQAAGGEDEYHIQLRRLRELASKAEAAYQSSLGDLTATYIYAPFDGTVVDVVKKEGETATAAGTVIELADLSKLIFEITVDQEDYGLLKKDQKVEVELDAHEGVVFEGTISKLPYYANGGDAADFTVEITMKVDPKYEILLGMTGDAYIVVDSTNDPVPSLVYDEILFDDEDNPYIWIVQNGVIAKQLIEIGLEGDIYTHVKTQVTDTIVVGVSDDTDINEGYKVKFAK